MPNKHAVESAVDFFPAQLAKAPRFCNRVTEQKTLARNIALGRHTVLISPRRYGKSSLAHKVATDTKLPLAAVDLFLAHNDATVTRRIVAGIAHLVSQIMPVTQKALLLVANYFKHFKIVITSEGYSLQISHGMSLTDSIEQLASSLQGLAKLAAEKKKKVLFFIDEFQDIVHAESAKAIQGAIRQVAQDSKDIVFIFSGSSRHLLLDLFDDSNKPLYMLCDKIMLGRIHACDYQDYIQTAALAVWRKELSDSTLQKIYTLTELHPFYINLLCNALWADFTTPPTEQDVITTWHKCYETEERRLVAELEKLTTNQQAILQALAITPEYELTGQAFLSRVHLSTSSAKTGMQSLLEKDLIHKITHEDSALPQLKKGQYRVLDPLLAHMLRIYE